MSLKALAALAAAFPLAARSFAQCEVEPVIPDDGIFLDLFGYAVALSGDRALIGAPHGETSEGGGQDPPGSHPGQAYVFELEGVHWVQKAKLTPSDGEDEDSFGFSVALSGGRALLGARWDDDLGFHSGSAYVFELFHGSWHEVAKLLPADGQALDLFGTAVALEGDRAIVTATGDDDGALNAGAVYVFERIAGQWVQTAKLLSAPAVTGGLFGRSLSLYGDRIVVGATGAGIGGAAFVLEDTGASWVQKARLLPADGTPGQAFGISVALRQDQILVGAPAWGTTTDPGSAYMYEASGSSWSQTAKLVASKGSPADAAGIAVALGKNRALVGAHFVDEETTSSGAAFLYYKDGGSWVQIGTLKASDAETGDPFGNQFGISASISGDVGLVGAWGHDASGNDSGKAYFFSLASKPVPSFAGTPAAVALSESGAQDLLLNGCVEWAGHSFLVLGSASGTSPGSTIGGVYMPLNFDIYYRDTLKNPNTPPLVTSLGTLDGAGDGAALFTTAFGLSPSLVGLTLHHAYRVIDPGTMSVVFVSNPVPVQVLP